MVYSPKTYPAPGALAAEKAKGNGTYRHQEVVALLIHDFYNKCYLCGDTKPTSINVEHFVPHQGNRDLEFDWSNLFYCCTHCNSTKGANINALLDCTIEPDVDQKIHYTIYPMPKEIPGFTALDDDPKIQNTVDLLRRIFNGNTPNQRIESSNLRKKLLAEVRKLNDLIFEYEESAFNEEERERLKREIVNELHRSSSFAAFKRWNVRDYFPEFSQFI